MDKYEIKGKIITLQKKLDRLSSLGRENGKAYQKALFTQNYLYRKLSELEEQDSVGDKANG